MDKNDLQKYINTFYKDFKCKLEHDNFTLLIDIFRNYINHEMSDVIDTEFYDEVETLEKEIKQKFNDGQLDLFNKWNDIQEGFWLDMTAQSFVYGFCLHKLLDDETKIGGVKNG